MPGWMSRGEVRAQPFTRYDETGLQALLDECENTMGRLSDQYLRMMGEHIRDIGTLWPSDVHRLQQLRRMRRNLRQIERRIANAAGRTEAQIRRVFEDIAREDERMARKILGVSDAASVTDNAALRRILQAQARETAGRMRNLSNTSVISTGYRKAVNEAVTAAQSGVEDYGTAIRRVIREAGQYGLRVTGDGVRKVDYESGYSRRLDSAVRMNILDGVRHLNQTVMEEIGRQFGADGVEIDAHMLCAEDHLPYQGGQYSNAEFEQIQDSLPRPFGEWNCRHSWHPIMLGVSPPAYRAEVLEEMRRFSTEPVTIDGRTKTRYEWSQEMRRCEAAIRQAKDTATLAASSGDAVLRRQCQETIGALNGHYARLAEQAGLKTEYQRTYVAGFRDAKTLTGAAKGGTIYSMKDTRESSIGIVNGQRLYETSPEIQAFTDVESAVEYFRSTDEWGAKVSPIDRDSFSGIKLSVLKELSEGIKWAQDHFNTGSDMPRSIRRDRLGKGTLGDYDDVKREIRFKHGLTIEYAYSTAVHEMTHHADNIMGHPAEDIVKAAYKKLRVEYSVKQLNRMRDEIAMKYSNDPHEVLAYSLDRYCVGKGNILARTISEDFIRRCREK